MTMHTPKLLIGLLMGLIIITLTGCGEPSKVKTGSETTPAKSETQVKQAATTKKATINKKSIVNGLNITIGEIQIEKERILVGITIRNGTNNKLSFYPDQGNVVVGSTQLDGNMFMTEGKVSGEIQPGVEKSGVVVFTVPEGKTLSPKEITSVTLHLGDVYNETSFSSKPFDVALTL